MSCLPISSPRYCCSTLRWMFEIVKLLYAASYTTTVLLVSNKIGGRTCCFPLFCDSPSSPETIFDGFFPDFFGCHQRVPSLVILIYVNKLDDKKAQTVPSFAFFGTVRHFEKFSCMLPKIEERLKISVPCEFSAIFLKNRIVLLQFLAETKRFASIEGSLDITALYNEKS